MKPVWIIIVLSFLVSACKHRSNDIVFLGHTYQWYAGNRVDKRLEKIDFSQFEEVWLGGDLCGKTTVDDKTLAYLDELFNLSSAQVHWALGNHDTRDGHLEKVESIKKRKSYYAHYENGFTRFVLNTNFNNIQAPPLQNVCNEPRNQLEQLKAVCDTIQRSSHLVLLAHHDVWGREFVENGKCQSNLKQWDYNFLCEENTGFQIQIYPMLVQVQNRGIQVIIITGDYGMVRKTSQFQSSDGIWFLGNGINGSIKKDKAPGYVRSFDPDSLLILNYNPDLRELSWRFEPMDSIVKTWRHR